MKKEIPFRVEFRGVMTRGIKTCTARTKIMASKGDTFEAFGLEFEITAVGRSSVGSVCQFLWLEEGCDSPEEFQAIWEKIHPRRGFVANDMVFVHCFMRRYEAGSHVQEGQG